MKLISINNHIKYQAFQAQWNNKDTQAAVDKADMIREINRYGQELPDDLKYTGEDFWELFKQGTAKMAMGGGNPDTSKPILKIIKVLNNFFVMAEDLGVKGDPKLILTKGCKNLSQLVLNNSERCQWAIDSLRDFNVCQLTKGIR